MKKVICSATVSYQRKINWQINSLQNKSGVTYLDDFIL